MGTQSEKFETSPAFHRKYMGAGGNACGGDEHGAALNKSRRIYGDDNYTLFPADRDGTPKFRSDLPSHLTQMGDAKTQMDDAKAPVAWVN